MALGFKKYAAPKMTIGSRLKADAMRRGLGFGNSSQAAPESAYDTTDTTGSSGGIDLGDIGLGAGMGLAALAGPIGIPVMIAGGLYKASQANKEAKQQEAMKQFDINSFASGEKPAGLDPHSQITWDESRPTTEDEQRAQLAKIAPESVAQMRAAQLFPPAETFSGAPMSGVDPETGQPMYAQVGSNGTTRPVTGIAPAPQPEGAVETFVSPDGKEKRSMNANSPMAQSLMQGGWLKYADVKQIGEKFGQPVEVDTPDGPKLVRFPNDGGPPVPVQGDYKPKSSGDLLSPEAIKMSVDQLLAGDPSPMQGLGYGNIGAKNRQALREGLAAEAQARNISGADLAAINAQYFGVKAGERTLGTRSANIDMAVNEASNMGKLARDASTAVPRGAWMPVNKAMQAWNEGTGSPEARTFGASVNSFLNAYATAVGKGTMTVDARNHAQELLSTADGPKAFEAIMDQLDKEMGAAKEAPGQVRAQLRDAITGREGAPAAAPARLTPGTVVDQLPPGAKMLPDGRAQLPDGTILRPQ